MASACIYSLQLSHPHRIYQSHHKYFWSLLNVVVYGNDGLEMIALQILNKIYVYLLCLFGIGYTLNGKEIYNNKYRLREKKHTLFASWNKHNLTHLNNLDDDNANSKQFKYIIDGEHIDINDDREENNDKICIFGHRYYYWFTFSKYRADEDILAAYITANATVFESILNALLPQFPDTVNVQESYVFIYLT